MAARKGGVTPEVMIDLAITLLPIVVILSIQYRDQLTRWKTRAEQMLSHYPDVNADALVQVQWEISQMEHGEYGGADAS